MSDKRKVRINLMDLSKFLKDVPFNHQQCVLDNLDYEVSFNYKKKELTIGYDGSYYQFNKEET